MGSLQEAVTAFVSTIRPGSEREAQGAGASRVTGDQSHGAVVLVSRQLVPRLRMVVPQAIGGHLEVDEVYTQPLEAGRARSRASPPASRKPAVATSWL